MPHHSQPVLWYERLLKLTIFSQDCDDNYLVASCECHYIKLHLKIYFFLLHNLIQVCR